MANPKTVDEQLDRTLSDLIRKARFEGWKRGKEQADTPTKYTLGDESYPKEIFKEAKTALHQLLLEEVLPEKIGTNSFPETDFSKGFKKGRGQTIDEIEERLNKLFNGGGDG